MTVLATIYGVAAGLMALMTLALLWGAVQGLWRRKFKFAAGAALLAIVFAGGALNMWSGVNGEHPASDPSDPQYR